ncbi:NDR1/HIN1-like protein 26 [Hordeum vulgare subsp. vulgare]|uniref:Late embryogenesis abundant protein LEA-2 subgroup domain-containing protein n=1 Tax=Hordeum vulgare subsp. vulgare TaxID=112509 RepID=A0A8I6YW60_HORVV|nr:NDR1/HIN1-like protein 26 [Hordeum vulgare subsp. vulgare]
MSRITDDPEHSPRDCATKHRHHNSAGRRRLLIGALSAAASLLALAIILWLTLRPSSPRFTLLAATATAPNATAGGIVRLDAAFVAHNPNAHAAVLYDRLQAHASYAGVQLAAAAPLPPFQQAQGDAVLTASLSASSAAASLAETAEAGRATLLLRLRVEGQLRWKVAAWVSGSRALAAECVAVVVPSQLTAVVVQGSQCATTLE